MRTHIYIWIIILLFLSSNVACANVETWSKTFGGTEWDKAYSVQQTSNGGYIIAGYTESYDAGNRDGWLVKTDSKGN